MAHFVIDIESPLTAAEAWLRLWDLRAHDEVIPFTRLSQAGGLGRLAAGARFTARTRLLGIGVDDPMEVVEFAPPTADAPGTCRIVKRGSVITGTVVTQVSPTSGGSRVHWDQDISVAHVPEALAPVTAIVARTAYARTLSSLLARPTAPDEQ